ncbi:chitosanase [Dactylosporangium vinaceum]|uniref:Chitosanase n=1 Tax=Dactylosporangium vinaceum TaxID=53362 RepID=A0ABV5ME56_9ACTN|nr:chitosanase [Dactylosporangium vinaceum]UAB92508.1 chitosanase [Dactylosporangium vinaceum]
MAVRRSVAGVAAVLAGVALAAPSAYAADAVVSRGRAAAASAGAATSAVDGRTATRWTTAGRAAQWLRVDLGAVTAVSRIRLSWATNFAKVYRLDASADGSTWTPLYATGAGDGRTDDLTGVRGSARFVRLTATPRTAKGLALGELEVFGHRAESAPAPASALSVDVAMQLVSSAENSSLDWRAQYGYIEDIGDGRGYTGGIIGFCSGTGDMLEVVEAYAAAVPGNALAKYLPALRSVNGTAAHTGLGDAFEDDWKRAAADPAFQKAQDDERNRVYLNPALAQAKADGLRALGQFAYFDAYVMHGPGDDASSFGGIRRAALAKVKPPAQGGDETAYLNAFLDARVAAMRTEEAHSDTSRVDTAQRAFLSAGNLDLRLPLSWKVYGDPYTIAA